MNWQKTVKVQNLSKNEIYVHILNIQIQHVSEKSAFVFFGFDLKCLVFLTLRCGHVDMCHSLSTCLYGTSSSSIRSHKNIKHTDSW